VIWFRFRFGCCGWGEGRREVVMIYDGLEDGRIQETEGIGAVLGSFSSGKDYLL
jgi:hypothetical protein